mmetsp:Transcript_19605/g.48243  ORF Transcript_19605/g.48243 Transcript_19605/m.48243 type:complete len:86 (+) Transcript_19605:238-495(+)
MISSESESVTIFFWESQKPITESKKKFSGKMLRGQFWQSLFQDSWPTGRSTWHLDERHPVPTVLNLCDPETCAIQRSLPDSFQST